LNEAPEQNRRLRREILIYFKGFAECVKRQGNTLAEQHNTLAEQDTGRAGHRQSRTPAERHTGPRSAFITKAAPVKLTFVLTRQP
jgi:hypothetical protein